MPMLQCSRIGARHGRNPCPRAKGRRAASFFQTVRRRSAVPALQTAEATRTILSTASASVQACSRLRRRNPKRTCVWGTGPAAIAGLLHLLTQLFLHCSLLLLLVPNHQPEMDGLPAFFITRGRVRRYRRTTSLIAHAGSTKRCCTRSGPRFNNGSFWDCVCTWWLIPLGKWVIPPIISGLTYLSHL